ncbi:thioredoxin-like protein [Truncatella angustata]|uniref:Thioredoxin-like protein n=1 Tax=Truncatella angustata TaxID=152316 RepID=A0A9P8UU40_9PEZI|nr:thioredoxin-like protein [Truncatella angustata]KAH6658253.1 thioredoxin-like protein [Truncatella angustata]
MKFDIKIISDSVCPWCYVGKRRVEAGIASYKAAHPNSSDTFNVSWYPYYLDPNAPVEGEVKADRYKRRFGDAKFAQIEQTLGAVGKEVGIDFSFGGRTGHTRDSHRLIRLAGQKSQETQNRVVDELFKRYFELEQDITSRDMLKSAAEAAGLDGEEVRSYLETNQGAEEVENEVLKARQLGVSGVPNIRINGMFEAPGAVDPDVFKRIFEKIADASAKA